MNELFDVDGAKPVLNGGVCACGHIFFPFQTFGCESCGAFGAALRPLKLEGRGEVFASATVHMKPGADLDAPFTIGAVRLAAGPVLRGLLEAGAPPAPHAVEAQISAAYTGADARFALRFALAEAR